VSARGGTTFALHFASALSGGTLHLRPDGNEDTATGAGGTVVTYVSAVTTVSAAHSASNASVGDAQLQVVASGGIAISAAVAHGGEQDVKGGGTAIATQLSGSEVVYGKDASATIGAGGLQYIYSGGTATSAVVNSDGIQEVYGSAVGTIIGDGGNAYIASGGTAIVDPAVPNGGSVQTFPMHGIDLPNIAFGAQTTLAYAENAAGTGGTLTVSDGRHAAAIALLGNYVAGSFVTAADGHGGTLVTEASQASPQPLLTQPRHG
jgi:autotransporter passenger strand-loop-strand repeat protein